MAEYLGDQATVLPSNTQAIMHFSNLFEQRRKERELERQRQAQMDQQRKFDLVKYLGNKLNSEDFHNAGTYQGVVNNGIAQTLDHVTQSLSKKVPVEQVYADGIKMIEDVRNTAIKAKEIHDRNAKGVAGIMSRDPYVDAGALADLTAHDTYYDADGNLKPLSEIDTDTPWAERAYRLHRDKIYPADAAGRAMDAYFKGQQLSDVNDPQVYDEKTGNVIRRGFKGKLPPIAKIVTDEKGLPVLKKSGSPVLDVTHSGYYRLPGDTEDFRDDNGQRVKVLDKDAFEQFYQGPVAGKIDAEVKEDLVKSGMEANSEYADMLRRKKAYELLLDKVDNNYKFTIPDDKSAEMKDRLLSRKLEGIRVAQSAERLNIEKKRAAKEDAADQLATPLMDYYADSKGKTLSFQDVPVIGKYIAPSLKYINVNDIDQGDLKTITGMDNLIKPENEDSKGSEGVDAKAQKNAIYPIKAPDGKLIFKIDDDGNWIGQDINGHPQVIDPNAAYIRQLNGEKGVNKQLQGGVMDKIKNAAKSVMSKIAGVKKVKIKGL